MNLSAILNTKLIPLSITSAQILDATSVGVSVLTAASAAAQLSAISSNLLTSSGGTLTVAGALAAVAPATADNSTNVPTTAFLTSNILRADLLQALTPSQRSQARTNSSSASTDALAGKNIAYNSRHVWSQFNYNNSIASVNGYVTDGYTILSSGIVASGQRVASPFTTRPDIPFGLRATITTAKATLSASDFLLMSHRVEGIRSRRLVFGTTAAKTAYVGVMVNFPAGTYYICMHNGLTSNRSFVQKFVIAAGNAGFDTFITMLIPGDTAGTWATDTSYALDIGITIAAGTTYQSATVGAWTSTSTFGGTDQTNGAVTANATFTMSDLILLDIAPGSVTDPTQVIPIDRLPFFVRQDDEELRICRRYWRSSYDAGVVPGTANAAGFLQQTNGPSSNSYAPIGCEAFDVIMRTTPTFVIYSNKTGSSGVSYNAAAGTDVASQASGGTQRVQLGVNGVAVSAYQTLQAHYTASSLL